MGVANQGNTGVNKIMSWKCRLIEKEDIKNAKFGDMYFAPWLEPMPKSPEYENSHRGKRSPLVIVIPSGVHLCIDQKATNMNGHGWTVTGEAPNITVHPSIGIQGPNGQGWSYHGWLKDGVLSDDIDGKKYRS